MRSTGRAASQGRHDREFWIGFALAVTGAAAFGAKGVVVKLAYRHGADPATLVAYRFVFALPLFLALAWIGGRGRSPLTREQWGTAAALGLIGSYLTSTFDFAGLQYITAGLERLIVYLTPTIVLLLHVLVFRRPANAVHVLAMAISYLGAVLVFGHEAAHSSAQVSLGSALVFASAITYAIHLTYSGEVVSSIGAFRLVGTASSIAALPALAQLLVHPPNTGLNTDAAVVGLSLANAVFCTFAPQVMVMLAIERIGSAMASQCGMIGPVATIGMGALLLDEPITAAVALGTALVLAGISLLAFAGRPLSPRLASPHDDTSTLSDPATRHGPR